MSDTIIRAREVIALLERNDADTLSDWRSERLWDWSVEDWIRERWMPRLGELAGSERRIIREREVSDLMARFVVEGGCGQALVTVRFDAKGMLDGLAMSEVDERRIPGGAVVACPDDRCAELSGFYAGLVRARLGFGEGRDYRAPRWPDPEYPQQMHFDILVHDLPASEEVVLAQGATKLEDNPGHRIYADPIGHPFCLYEDTSGRADAKGLPGVLARIVIDCPDPLVLAPFYEGLLGVPKRVEESPQRVVIAEGRDTLPMLAFQRVEHYVAPRWPDPHYPVQMHFDLSFDDREAAERLAIQLGATLLPPQGGSCPVYADPVGHPFCLCMPGE